MLAVMVGGLWLAVETYQRLFRYMQPRMTDRTSWVGIVLGTPAALVVVALVAGLALAVGVMYMTVVAIGAIVVFAILGALAGALRR